MHLVRSTVTRERGKTHQEEPWQKGRRGAVPTEQIWQGMAGSEDPRRWRAVRGGALVVS